MRSFFIIPLLLLLLTPQNISAEVPPVTGDSGSILTASDRIPAENKPETVSRAVNDSSGTMAPLDSSIVVPENKVVVPENKAASSENDENITNTDSLNSASIHIIKTPVKAATAWETDTLPAVNTDTIPVHTLDTAVVSTVEQQADTPAVMPGTLIITSIPDSVQIVINDMNVGTTPYHVSGFSPGLYDVVLTAAGYQPFKKTIDLKSGGTEFLTGNLEKAAGFLHVTSTPENASVLLNDTVVGMTPYMSPPLQPGIYHLKIDLPGYTSYMEQLGVSAGLTDTLQITLLSLEKPGFFENVHFKNTQKIRRIVFSTLGVISTAAGIYYNMRARHHLDGEKSAWDQYREASLSEAEYANRYELYRYHTKYTDRFTLLRNICYGLGITGGVGFLISLPY